MSYAERIELYKKIEKHRKRPLIVYVTSKRVGLDAESQMSNDALPQIIRQIDALPANSPAVDFLIVSNGGDPMVAWRIMTLIRQRVEPVNVLIPQSAYSAATLVAFGADEIIMHPNGHLGPVDMQITISRAGGTRSFSTEDISAFLEFVRDNLKITDQEHVRRLFELTCQEIGTVAIGFIAKSSKLAVDLAERLLLLHMKEDEKRAKIPMIVETMSRKFHAHAYPVNRSEALDIGLPVNRERDKKLEDLMWQVWLDIEADLKETIPFDVVIELLNSPEASKLLAPVPQIDIAFSTSAASSYQTTIDQAITAAQSHIDPVDFEYTTAIVESSRAAYANIAKGKILACRTPDLVIRSNRVLTSVEWTKAS